MEIKTISCGENKEYGSICGWNNFICKECKAKQKLQDAKRGKSRIMEFPIKFEIDKCISVERYKDGSICIIGRYENSPECKDNIWLVKEGAKKLCDAIGKDTVEVLDDGK